MQTFISLARATERLGIDRYQLRYWRHRLGINTYPMPEDAERRQDRRRRFLAETDVSRLERVLRQQVEDVYHASGALKSGSQKEASCERQALPGKGMMTGVGSRRTLAPSAQ